MARVTGIGGVFIRANDPKALQDWYIRHLGIEPDQDGYRELFETACTASHIRDALH